MTILAAALALLQAQPACTEQVAQSITIEVVNAAPEQWLDKCISVSGIAGGLELYAGLEELYRRARFGAGGNFEPKNLRHRIGIDHRDLRVNSEFDRRATRIRVTGVVDSCERRSQRIREAGGIAFLSGYCHYHEGAVLVLSSFSVLPDRYERLVGEAARRRAGNLIELPADWQWRDDLEALARDFAAAVDAGDRHRLATLLSYGSGLEEQRIDFILNSPSFADLRDGRVGEIQLLTHSIGGQFRPIDSTHTSANLCFCRVGDCTGLWPIGSVDVDAGEDRPYVCISVSGRIAPPADLDMYVPSSGGWLAEPRRRQ